MTPEFAHHKPDHEWELGYKAGRRAALEEAARVAEECIDGTYADLRAKEIAAAIRALKEEK